MYKRILSILLIWLHLITFGPIREIFAFSSSSTTYNLTAGSLSQGGRDREASTMMFTQDTIGEASIGRTTSTSYILDAGFIPTVTSNPPLQTLIIPNQNWRENESKIYAFDLDDYFISPEGYTLNYTVSGSSNVDVTIDSTTHLVSFSQAPAWFGAEAIKRQAIKGTVLFLSIKGTVLFLLT